MRSLYSPSRRIASRFDPRNFGSYGLFPAQRKCKCCEAGAIGCAADCTHCKPCDVRPACACPECCAPPVVRVTISGSTTCELCKELCDSFGVVDESFKITFLNGFNLNGAWDLERVSACEWRYTFVNAAKQELWHATSNTTCAGAPDTTRTYNAVFRLIRSSTGWLFIVEGNTGDTQSSFFHSTEQAAPLGNCTSIPTFNNENTECFPDQGNCPGVPEPGYTAFSIGGTASFEICPNDLPIEDCCAGLECSLCAGCSEANEVACGAERTCCTPDTIRAVTSSVTNCIGQCVTATAGTIQSYKLSGTTALNRTIDLAQLALAGCTWRGEVASDHVLARATKHTLSTLRYRATRDTNTTWRMQVWAHNIGSTQVVHFFDGTIDTGSGLTRCSAAATANNSLTCDLCAATKTAGNSGTFAKPSTVGSVGTDCGNCTIGDTPASFSATIASVVTCLNSCECTNRWKLTGSTAINRTITLNQVGGSPCILEGTVAANYILYDHDTAAATFNISTLRYELIRTGTTSATWKIVGMDGATQRITYASGTSAVSTKNCKTWGTSTHTSPACSANGTSETAVMGGAGSTTLTACPV